MIIECSSATPVSVSTEAVLRGQAEGHSLERWAMYVE